ncbi:High-affnity carbon uptake protein Hat/HatR [Minicystis rosea]|nr:High-affnity carbon uptake protein Hat/HatR [Minicystis rosea]
MQTPLELTLELARAEDAGDPFAFRFAEQTYLLRGEDGSVAESSFPWGSAIVEDLAGVQRARPDRAAAQRLGDRLRSFLDSAGWRAHEERIRQAERDGRPVHLTVRSAAAEMYALPWELCTLRSSGRHLGELPNCLIRYEWPGTETTLPDIDPPPAGGRILFAWSAAGGAVPAQAHLGALLRATSEGGVPFDESTDVVPHVSRASLQSALSAKHGERTTILHILCHGGRVASSTEAHGLVWNGSEDGDPPEIVDAGTLRQVLAPHAGTIRLVVLCACQGGDMGALDNHLGSVAQALHRLGIPAVVASRHPLSIDGSVIFAESFHRRLLVEPSSLEAAFLEARAKVAERAERIDWASLQLYVRAADGPDHRPITFRPYQGLSAFQPTDARFHFGRAEDVARIVALLQDGRRFVSVVGASGSGKSSLVMAGVIPALARGALGGGPIEARVLRPGRAPCQALAAALADRSEGSADMPEILVVIDQFEEIFLEHDHAEAAAFIDRLIEATSSPTLRARAIITLRADFLGHCLDHRALAERVRASMDISLPMSDTQLREAIVRPAELTGLRFEAGLVEALIDALRDEGREEQPRSAEDAPIAAGNLPLLAFALEALWENRRGDTLSWSAWRTMGGLRGAIARRADRVLEAHGDRDRDLLRQIFGRLVQLGEGAADTRRSATRAELEAVAPGEARSLVDAWIHARLLVADEAEVRIAHETLIREWPTLRRWIDEHRQALRAAQAIREGAQRWESAARSADELWRGERLKRAIAWREDLHLSLSARESAFLEAAASTERHEREAVARRRAHERESDLRVGRRPTLVGSAVLVALVAICGVVHFEVHPIAADHVSALSFLGLVSAFLVAMVVVTRRRSIGNRASRTFWASYLAVLLTMLLSHATALWHHIPVLYTFVNDDIAGVATMTILGIAFHGRLAAGAIPFLLGIPAMRRWPHACVGIELLVMLLFLSTTTLVWYFMPEAPDGSEEEPMLEAR